MTIASMSKLSDRFTNVCLAWRFSLRGLARRLGVSQGTVHTWLVETGPGTQFLGVGVELLGEYGGCDRQRGDALHQVVAGLANPAMPDLQWKHFVDRCRPGWHTAEEIEVLVQEAKVLRSVGTFDQKQAASEKLVQLIRARVNAKKWEEHGKGPMRGENTDVLGYTESVFTLRSELVSGDDEFLADTRKELERRGIDLHHHGEGWEIFLELLPSQPGQRMRED